MSEDDGPGTRAMAIGFKVILEALCRDAKRDLGRSSMSVGSLARRVRVEVIAYVPTQYNH